MSNLHLLSFHWNSQYSQSHVREAHYCQSQQPSMLHECKCTGVYDKVQTAGYAQDSQDAFSEPRQVTCHGNVLKVQTLHQLLSYLQKVWNPWTLTLPGLQPVPSGGGIQLPLLDVAESEHKVCTSAHFRIHLIALSSLSCCTKFIVTCPVSPAHSLVPLMAISSLYDFEFQHIQKYMFKL